MPLHMLYHSGDMGRKRFQAEIIITENNTPRALMFILAESFNII